MPFKRFRKQVILMMPRIIVTSYCTISNSCKIPCNDWSVRQKSKSTKKVVEELLAHLQKYLPTEDRSKQTSDMSCIHYGKLIWCRLLMMSILNSFITVHHVNTRYVHDQSPESAYFKDWRLFQIVGGAHPLSPHQLSLQVSRAIDIKAFILSQETSSRSVSVWH